MLSGALRKYTNSQHRKAIRARRVVKHASDEERRK